MARVFCVVAGNFGGPCQRPTSVGPVWVPIRIPKYARALPAPYGVWSRHFRLAVDGGTHCCGRRPAMLLPHPAAARRTFTDRLSLGAGIQPVPVAPVSIGIVVSIAAVVVTQTMINRGVELEIATSPDVAGETTRIGSSLARTLIKVQHASITMPFSVVIACRGGAGPVAQPELGKDPPPSISNVPIVSVDHEAHIVAIRSALICPRGYGEEMDSNKAAFVYDIASIGRVRGCEDLQPTQDEPGLTAGKRFVIVARSERCAYKLRGDAKLAIELPTDVNGAQEMPTSTVDVFVELPVGMIVGLVAKLDEEITVAWRRINPVPRGFFCGIPWTKLVSDPILVDHIEIAGLGADNCPARKVAYVAAIAVVPWLVQAVGRHHFDNGVSTKTYAFCQLFIGCAYKGRANIAVNGSHGLPFLSVCWRPS